MFEAIPTTMAELKPGMAGWLSQGVLIGFRVLGTLGLGRFRAVGFKGFRVEGVSLLKMRTINQSECEGPPIAPCVLPKVLVCA